MFNDTFILTGEGNVIFTYLKKRKRKDNAGNGHAVQRESDEQQSCNNELVHKVNSMMQAFPPAYTFLLSLSS